MPKEFEKYKDVFLSEAKENISAMNKALLKLEENPTKVELVNEIFRRIHTLKGMADTMNYHEIVSLCHALEDLLDTIKNRKVKLDECVDIIFECFDTLEAIVKRLEDGKEELDTVTDVEKLQTFLKAGKVIKDTRYEIRDTQIEKIKSIEVKVERLDLLMNLVEELLINKMRLKSIKEDLQNPELNSAIDKLSRLIAEVQYNVMQTRMLPIGFVFNRFPRMVRDLAKRQGKQVNLLMKGTDIELDRSVIDKIGECLVHLLRNAVDHGIEKPQERKKAGKPPEGTLTLTASRTKSFAIIEINDDGAGLNFAEIKNTTIKRGLLSPQASKEEVMASIFSGLSTTKTATVVSGRGFGLNIAKNKIESLGGTIKVESSPKTRTRFIIEIPLTLAVIKALFVEVAGKPYAIPLTSVERLVTVNKDDIKGMLNSANIILDDENIPITKLDVLFGTPPQDLLKQPIVIIRKGNELFGLAVNAFINTQEIVIKPLNKLIGYDKYFAGTTIIGSGEVVLILDVVSLMHSKKQDVRNRESYLVSG